ncbi:interleukin-34 [Betta splendens]|uniref:Interleukin-34 n=1 Tax=Betta splendens TaxID=158456 RepID=A0A6P7MNR4_BETSP|nr:interleukin-34 [Betta splendens]
MVHLSSAACLLGGLVGLFLLAPVLTGHTPGSMCKPLSTLNDSLSHRRRFMKHYFPINYTVRVHHKEIFKLKNIHRMRFRVQGLDDFVLQRLWFQVNQGVLKKILRVLPERHPSRPYTAELASRFNDVEDIFRQAHGPEVLQQEIPDAIQDIFDSLTEIPDSVPKSGWRLASPKSLLDNFSHTMHCLFSNCFTNQTAQDYCAVSYWRKGRKKETQSES